MEIPQGPLASLVRRYPTTQAWLASEPEDMGIVLLRELASGTMQRQFSGNALALMLRESYGRFWGPEWTHKILDAFSEAYAWLNAAGLIVPSLLNRELDIVSRRGHGMTDGQFTEFRAARRSGYEILDRRIVDKVWSIYLRGDYDIAIAYAFKVVEIRMRDKGGFTSNDVGERLAKKFFARFNSEAPKKSEKSLPSVVSLFIGAYDYRNSAAHEHPEIHDPEEAMEVLLLANHCLRIVERSEEVAQPDPGDAAT